MLVENTIIDGDKLTPIKNNISYMNFEFNGLSHTNDKLWYGCYPNKNFPKIQYYVSKFSDFKETKYFNKKLKKGDTLTLLSGTEVSLEDYKIDDLGVTLHLKKPSGEFINPVYETNKLMLGILELQYIKNILDILDKESFGEIIQYKVYIDSKPAKYPDYTIDPKYNTNIFSTKEEAISYVNMWLGVFGNIVSSHDNTESFISNNGVNILIKKISKKRFNLVEEYKKVTELEELFNLLYDMSKLVNDSSSLYKFITTGKSSIILSKHPDFEYSIITGTNKSIEFFLDGLLEYSEKYRSRFRKECKDNNITIDDFYKLL